MVLVRRLHKRNATIVVEANAEVLFAPTTEVGRWEARLRERIAAAVVAGMPTNKRPRWGHYGKPLKATVRRSVTYQPGRMRIYGAVGSTAPHSYYVDQGTGIYAGNGPYPAKILPPWTRGSASLYEHTWRPGGPGTRKVTGVLIRGQRGQHFFDEGLKRGFQSMRMRSYQIPGDGRIGDILASIPTGLEGFAGNTVSNEAFRASLSEWREWRDAHFARGDTLGKNGGAARRAAQAAAIRAGKPHRPSKPKSVKPKPVKPTRPPRPPSHTKAQIAALLHRAIKKERAALLAQATEKYAGKRVEVSGRLRHDGVYAFKVTITYKGRSIDFWVTSDYQANL